MSIDPADAKRALRALLRGSRPGGDVSALQRRMLALDLPATATIAGVCALPGEPDLVAVWTTLHGRGHTVVMPETTAPGSFLLFRVWRPGDALLPGRFGTRHPAGPAAVPSLLFVPLLCWDLDCNRLGYGGGYYDRTLAALPGAQTIGFGFESQRVDKVPTEPFDFPLTAIVTETRTVFRKGPDV